MLSTTWVSHAFFNFLWKYKKAGAENKRRKLQSGEKEQHTVISGYANHAECAISKLFKLFSRDAENLSGRPDFKMQ